MSSQEYLDKMTDIQESILIFLEEEVKSEDKLLIPEDKLIVQKSLKISIIFCYYCT